MAEQQFSGDRTFALIRLAIDAGGTAYAPQTMDDLRAQFMLLDEELARLRNPQHTIKSLPPQPDALKLDIGSAKSADSFCQCELRIGNGIR